MAVSRARALPLYFAVLVALVLSAVPLGDVLAPFRPDWVLLVLIYMAIHMPQRFVLTTAVASGLVLDAMNGTPLGQYPLAMVIALYFPLRLHLRLTLAPIWQSIGSMAVFVAVYQFMLFWINGATDNNVGLFNYLWPVVTAVLVWPLLLVILDTARLGRIGKK